jgi:hypothetical protein
MGEVVSLRPRSRPVQPITIEQVSIQDILNVTLGNQLCRHCAGRGWIFTADRYSLSVGPCPCGGDDENRITADDPDYPGAA